jgi:D-2-hydroxyacid dehydrogenase (NADP+)
MLMKVLVLDTGVHVDADTLQATFSQVRVFGAKTEAEALTVCAPCEVLISTSHAPTERLLESMPALRYILSVTTGVDHLWTLRSLAPSVRITNARGIHGPQMAELVFTYMLGLTRDVRRLLRNQVNKAWDRWAQPILSGKTVVIVGLGAIAEDITRRCRSFELQVIGVSDARVSFPGCARVYPRTQLLEAASVADFLIVLVPLDADTTGMINADVFNVMKPTARIINIARGAVVDEEALIAALQNGQIAGAGLDVFVNEPLPKDSPLWSMDNVLITPRVGGMSDRYAQQALPLIVHNLQAWIEGRPSDLRNVIR